RPKQKMSRINRGRVLGFGAGARRVKAITALPLLVTSAALAVGCGSSDRAQTASAEGEALAPVLGKAREALVTSTVFDATGDTFIRSALPNQNEGSNTQLQVQISSRHRSLVYFDTAAIRAATAGHVVVSAQVELGIVSTALNWNSGRAIGI